MLTLSILRHAKSSWDVTELDDFDRPLAKRGAKAAPEIGAKLASEKLVPDLVLCSTAIRTRATLALVIPELPAPPAEIKYEDELYLAPPSVLLDRLRRVTGSVAHILLVGHNPGLHGLALELTADGSRDDLRDLATKFPTGTLAVLTFKLDRWSEIGPATGDLKLFVTPKER